MKKRTMDELGRVDAETFKNAEKQPIVVVLDSIRSMLNVGSAFRTADAFAIEKMVLCGITAQPPHREINKTALGATESVEWEHHASVSEAVQQLQAEGYQIVLVEQIDQSVSLEDFPVEKEGKYALVFGNEAMGVSEELLSLPEVKALEIPQFGTKHSLNVSVSIGVVLWHFTLRGKLR